MVLLCGHHHRQIHEGGFSLRLTAAGEVEVLTPDGDCLPAVPMLSADLGTIDWGSDWWDGAGTRTGTGSATVIDEWTATPSWDGEAVDYDWAVGAMIVA